VTPPDLTISHVDVPTAAQAEQIRRAAVASPGAGTSPPISERGLLHLRAGAPIGHLVAEQDGRLVGYAQLDPGAGHVGVELVATGPAAVESAVALIERAEHAAGARPVRLWAHGAQSVAHAAAARLGLTGVRVLLQLRRSLTDLELPDPTEEPLPDGVRIRTFALGQDERPWLAVNARAFAHHPEQGSWTAADLTARVEADWFDPAGFFVAERAGRLIGYHWTKVHRDLEPPLGEVYVLGVDPDAQGLRLGRALLVSGLRYLRDLGLPAVLLYTDASNTAAMTLYTKLGFEVFGTDTQYARDVA